MDEDDFASYSERLQLAFTRTMRKLGPELAENDQTGLTGPQFFILSLLTRRDKTTVSELAAEMRVKPSAITAMIDRLHKHGLVHRDRDDQDRRIVYIQLTETGLHTLEQNRLNRVRILNRYLRQLEERELETFVRLFEKFAEIVLSESSSGDHSPKIEG